MIQKFDHDQTNGNIDINKRVGVEECWSNINNVPTMQLFTGISRNTQAKLYMLSLSECVQGIQKQCIVEYLSTYPIAYKIKKINKDFPTYCTVVGN